MTNPGFYMTTLRHEGLPGADEIAVDAFFMAIVGYVPTSQRFPFLREVGALEAHRQRSCLDTYVNAFEAPVYFDG